LLSLPLAWMARFEDIGLGRRMAKGGTIGRDYSTLGIGVDRRQDAKRLFPQEKVTLKCYKLVIGSPPEVKAVW